MSYLDFVVMAAPAIIGLTGALTLGPKRGTLISASVMLVAVFGLLLLQVTAETRFGSAFGLMKFEWYRWLPSFLLGAAVGTAIYRVRR